MVGVTRRLAMLGTLAVTLISAACASGSSGGGAGPAGQETLRIGNQGGRVALVDLNTTERAVTDTFAVDASQAFAAVPALFKVLGLPLIRRDQARRINVAGGNPRRIDDQPLSRFLECGRSITAGPNADSYQVAVTVETQVVPVAGDPSRATLKTTLRATAAPLASSGNSVTCESTGRLEQRIAELMRMKLANGAG